MPASKAQQRAVAKYMAANYYELKIRVPKGRKAVVEAYAKERGLSVNGLVNRLLQEAVGIKDADWKKSEEL